MANRQIDGFGVKLREAREGRGMSLREIANTTRISMSQLEALERNDISRLPGGIFSRAFVRSYAIEVGLDPEETVREFIAQFPQDSVTAGHPTSAPVEDSVAVEGDRRMASAYLRLLLLSVPIAVVLLYFGVSGWPRAVKPAQAPALVARASDPVAADPTPASPGLDPGGSPADAAATGSVLPAAAAEPVIAPDVRPVAPPSAEGAAGHLAVSLIATRPCRVVATVDGERAVGRLLKAGDRRLLDVRRDLILTVSDPAALVVTFNGAEAGPLGKAGERTTITLTLENFRQYLAGR